MTDAPIYLFDGRCVLCSRGARYVLKHEKAPETRFVAFQSAEGRRLAEAHGIDPEAPQTFLFVEGGEALKKSDGVFALLARIGGPARLLLPLRFLPRGLRDFVYDFVARNRYAWFGRTETCLVPDAETRARFVLPEG